MGTSQGAGPGGMSSASGTAGSGTTAAGGDTRATLRTVKHSLPDGRNRYVTAESVDESMDES